jgi:two-component system CheB/CheR fusion protein
MLPSSSRRNMRAPAHAEMERPRGQPVIFVVDDDRHLRERIRGLLAEGGWTAEDYATYEAFLEAYHAHRLNGARSWQSAIVITRGSNESMAIQVMWAGTSDFIAEPVERDELLVGVERAFEHSRGSRRPVDIWESPNHGTAKLTRRQLQIMELVLAGHPSKNIAADLGISQRTVEKHRASIMKRTGAKSLPALTQLVLGRPGSAWKKSFS